MPGYEEFKVAYYSGGKRKLETFADFEKAKERAGKINGSVNTGNTDTLTLNGKDLIAFTRAVEALNPSGVALDLAALQSLWRGRCLWPGSRPSIP